MVMSDRSCLKGCGFESVGCVLDGNFFTLICCKNCIVCLKRPKINEKEAHFLTFDAVTLLVVPIISSYETFTLIVRVFIRPMCQDIKHNLIA